MRAPVPEQIELAALEVMNSGGIAAAADAMIRVDAAEQVIRYCTGIWNQSKFCNKARGDKSSHL